LSIEEEFQAGGGGELMATPHTLSSSIVVCMTNGESSSATRLSILRITYFIVERVLDNSLDKAWSRRSSVERCKAVQDAKVV
jgi:hypothetical protein